MALEEATGDTGKGKKEGWKEQTTSESDVVSAGSSEAAFKFSCLVYIGADGLTSVV